MRSDPEIALDDVSLRFGAGETAVDALKNVSLTVAVGEFVSIVGESGCGKTSLLRMIAGLERPTGGRLHVAGTPVAGPLDGVGFVFQRPVLLPWKNVLENVLMPVRMAGRITPEARSRAKELLELVGLSDFAAAFPRQLSGGMQQRVSIARTLVTEPSVLLMDEPFGALDAITREQLNLDLLEIWSATGATCVFITHDIDEAVMLSDRVVLMSPRPGRVTREYAVDLPRPRQQAQRYSTGFADLSRSIHEEMTAHAGGGRTR